MEDIRMFMKEDILYMYERSNARVGLDTPVMSIRRCSDFYNVKTTRISIGNESTESIESIIVQTINELSSDYRVSESELISTVGSYLHATNGIIDLAIFTLKKKSKVEEIMTEVLSLNSKERADLMLYLLDLL